MKTPSTALLQGFPGSGTSPPAMLSLLVTLLATACDVVRPRTDLLLEVAALREQLGVLERQTKRPQLRRADRVFWVWLSRHWPRWKSALVIVKPETVLRWHREGYRRYWRWKSKGKPPPLADDRLTLLDDGKVALRLRHRRKDGTVAIVLPADELSARSSRVPHATSSTSSRPSRSESSRIGLPPRQCASRPSPRPSPSESGASSSEP